MNAIRTLKVASGVLIVVTSINAWSQSSEPAATSMGSGTSATSQGMSKSDVRKANRALSKKVLHALSKGGVDTAGVSVIVKGSAITLAGHVPDASQVEKAGTAAKNVSGVTSVKNALTIKEAGGH
ncbi:transport-associated protein [Caballeronia turbans]|uniref:BON domain-containing protein n=1 Tax=Caballeronia sp. INML2 TaxID=2921748 RepID=UPI00074CEFD4|nr:BON domain-containing protein [Caballeronia sp. INML2]SAL60594.1 transport-associated protein [Caballeronia turbans]